MDTKLPVPGERAPTWIDGRDLPEYRAGGFRGETMEVKQISDPLRCARTTLCKVVIYTQAEMDAALAQREGEVWQKAIEVVRDYGLGNIDVPFESAKVSYPSALRSRIACRFASRTGLAVAGAGVTRVTIASTSLYLRSPSFLLPTVTPNNLQISAAIDSGFGNMRILQDCDEDFELFGWQR